MEDGDLSKRKRILENHVRVAAGSALHPPQNHTQEKKNFKNFFEVQRTGQ
jgi:hypothetical protein